MPRKCSVPIEITAEERQELRNLRRSSPKKRNWVRADIILRVTEGQTNYMIAKQLGLSRNTVQHWRYRFARERLAGLQTRPIPGRPKGTTEIQSVNGHLRMEQSQPQGTTHER
jgi:transposase